MSEAVAVHGAVEPAETPLTPESWGKLGMWLFLAGDAMSFGGLIVAYGALRYHSKSWPVPAEVLGINLTALMTFLLIVSSVTMVLGLAALQDGDKPRFKKFMGLTILGGAIFLGLQAYEWTHLIGHTLPHYKLAFSTDLFATTFFVLTGFHGMHVTGGVIYNILRAGGGQSRPLPSQACRDRRPLLALRRSRVDFDLYVRLFVIVKH